MQSNPGNPKIMSWGLRKSPIWGSRGGPERGPEGIKSVRRGLWNLSWSLFSSGRPLEPLLEASWGALGGLRGRKKVLLNGSWRVQERFPRQVSAILGAKRLPKGRPRGSKIDAKKRLELKTRFLQKAAFSLWFLMVFEVPGFLFGCQNQYKMASDRI